MANYCNKRPYWIRHWLIVCSYLHGGTNSGLLRRNKIKTYLPIYTSRKTYLFFVERCAFPRRDSAIMWDANPLNLQGVTSLLLVAGTREHFCTEPRTCHGYPFPGPCWHGMLQPWRPNQLNERQVSKCLDARGPLRWVWWVASSQSRWCAENRKSGASPYHTLPLCRSTISAI